MRHKNSVSTKSNQMIKHNFNFSKPLWMFTFLLMAIFSWQCKKDNFIATEGICPEVLTTSPTDGEVNVLLNKKISAVFNEAMDPLTINNSTFILQQGSTQIAGTVTYSGNTAIFSPASYLAKNTIYTATITRGAKDPKKSAMKVNHVWKFTTGTSSSTGISSNTPKVISTDPTDGATNVALNKKILAEFNKDMNATTITASSFKVSQGTTAVSGIVSFTGSTAKFVPTANLSSNTLYTVTITTDAKDLSGKSLASDYTWSFTTGTVVKTTPPTVILTDPANNATAVQINKTVTAKFSEMMDPSTINTSTFILKKGTTIVPGMVSYSGTTASFNPNSNLLSNTLYTANITTGAEDATGNAIASTYVWTFTTGTIVVANPTGPPNVNLRSAGDFAILAGSGITNTGLTIINGDAGTSPTGTVNGFPPGVVNGSIEAANSIAAQAKLDLTTAYNDAQGRSTGAISLPGNLSGLTFAPGLYSNSSSVMLSAGNVTLDAKGDANAVFIFKMGSTLTTLPGTKIILSGGAQAKNIFWAVGSSATIGSNSIFYGNILADQSISLNTGATLNGRALTRIGAITLQSNIVNMP